MDGHEGCKFVLYLDIFMENAASLIVFCWYFLGFSSQVVQHYMMNCTLSRESGICEMVLGQGVGRGAT